MRHFVCFVNSRLWNQYKNEAFYEDRAFCEKSQRPLAVNFFQKTLHFTPPVSSSQVNVFNTYKEIYDQDETSISLIYTQCMRFDRIFLFQYRLQKARTVVKECEACVAEIRHLLFQMNKWRWLEHICTLFCKQHFYFYKKHQVEIGKSLVKN